MDESTYQLIALGALTISYIGTDIYLTRQGNKTIRNFANWVNTDFKYMAQEFQNTINDFKESSNNLLNKLRRNENEC